MSPRRRHLPAELARALELVAPGTDLREAIDNVIRAHNGALIVLDNPGKLESLGIISGGMKVEVEFAPMRLYELAKMDGAIVVSPGYLRHPLRERPAQSGPRPRIRGDRNAPPGGPPHGAADG